MSHILDTARLGLIEQAGTAVAILVEGLERSELLRSRLTRSEVLRQLQLLAASAVEVEVAMRERMPELDWSLWDSMGARLASPAADTRDETLWFAVSSLVPATLLWLRVYQQSEPELFRMASAC
jgi:uncharacterized protein with HEPN domain